MSGGSRGAVKSLRSAYKWSRHISYTLTAKLSVGITMEQSAKHGQVLSGVVIGVSSHAAGCLGQMCEADSGGRNVPVY